MTWPTGGMVGRGVQDSGPGLDAASLERIFQAFYTPNLAVWGGAYRSTAPSSYGGRLWATAGSPKGAIFRFTLPVDQDSTL